MDSLETAKLALAANNFDVYSAADPQQARLIFHEQILPQLEVRTVSWGDSMTMLETGVLNDLLQDERFEVIKTFDKTIPPGAVIARRRQALLADLFLTGSNAVTTCGKLVNLDMIGNRTSAIAFGPKKVVIFAGRNKLTADLTAAMNRVRTVAAPLNAKRHDFPTPCAKTGLCHDCSSPKRICNTWTIIDKCYPPGRIKVVLIDQEWGL
ncbi:MAG: lactate utilization protein [Desulfuromonadales bacterium]|nr:lactate utilization protein [Desulfuromonadales bacterium]